MFLGDKKLYWRCSNCYRIIIGKFGDIALDEVIFKLNFIGLRVMF